MKPYLSAFLVFLTMSVGISNAEEPASKADDPEFVRQAALKIDTYVAGWYRQQKLPVPEVTNDSTFLRRAFQVGIGRAPTTEEGLFFLELDEEDKRVQLIEYLMNSKGYGSAMTNWAFDLLRVVDSTRGPSLRSYRTWVADAMNENMPWDEFTRKILATRGSLWVDGQQPVGYYLRDQGMPLDNLANSMEIFLSTKMECAQCHDDPFGPTERREFYELAAFTDGQSGPSNKGAMQKIYRESREPEQRRTQFASVVELMWTDVLEGTLAGGGNGRIKLPNDYDSRDGDPGELIGARTPFGKSVRMSERSGGGDGREKLAEWVTTKTGEQFPAAIANRMWKRVMGRGIYEPIHSYIPAKDTNLPGLMTFLTGLMVQMDYDLKGFQKVLMNTKTFQFVPNPNPPKVQNGDDFHGRQLTRLSSEQVWDSLITLVGGDPDKKARRSVDDRIYMGGRPVLEGKKTMSELTKEVLALKSEKEFRSYVDDLIAQVGKGGKSKGSGSDSMMMERRSVSYGGNALVRASELPSPAPKNHPLFLFGASEREVVEASSSEPNVGQVLTLMNGFVQKQLVNNRDAHIYKSLKGASDPAEKIRRLYVGILNRPPSDEELSWMLDEVKITGDTQEAYSNILAALVMSSEFLFLQ